MYLLQRLQSLLTYPSQSDSSWSSAGSAACVSDRCSAVCDLQVCWDWASRAGWHWYPCARQHQRRRRTSSNQAADVRYPSDWCSKDIELASCYSCHNWVTWNNSKNGGKIRQDKKEDHHSKDRHHSRKLTTIVLPPPPPPHHHHHPPVKLQYCY